MTEWKDDAGAALLARVSTGGRLEVNPEITPEQAASLIEKLAPKIGGTFPDGAEGIERLAREIAGHFYSSRLMRENSEDAARVAYDEQHTSRENMRASLQSEASIAELISRMQERDREQWKERDDENKRLLDSTVSRLKREHARALKAMNFQTDRPSVEWAAMLTVNLRAIAQGMRPTQQSQTSAVARAFKKYPELVGKLTNERMLEHLHEFARPEQPQPGGPGRAQLANVNKLRKKAGLTQLCAIKREEEADIAVELSAMAGKLFVAADSKANEAEAAAEAITGVLKILGKHYGHHLRQPSPRKQGKSSPEKKEKSQTSRKNAASVTGSASVSDSIGVLQTPLRWQSTSSQTHPRTGKGRRSAG